MACIELAGRLLIVDVGLSFPHADMPGIDLVLPDFEYVRERAADVEAVVLTHIDAVEPRLVGDDGGVDQHAVPLRRQHRG